MKRIITITLALALALGLAAALAGCGQGRPPAPLDATRELVYDMGWRENARVPRVNLDSEDAARINEHIAWAQSSFNLSRSDFFYARHGDILSLIFCMASGDGNFEHHTFALNTATGALVSNAELLALAGWDFDELAETLRAKIGQFYEGHRDAYGELPPPRESPVRRIHDKMLSELTMPEMPRLFLSEDGRLFWVAQLSFGEGLALEDGTVFGGRHDFVEMLMDPAMPSEAFALDSGIVELFGWEMLS